ncbi:DUF1501 domain-containing protein [bacterium]|nr:DUF1501 domain-containing protein [bacterium]
MLTTRRDFLWQSGGGLGGIALASMMGQEAQFPPKAKRVVQLFMSGAASHLDLFDFKPELIKRHGEKSDFGEHVEAFQNGLGPWKKPVWEFSPHGQSGKMLGETVAPLGEVVDDIAFIHNLTGKTGVHSQATYLQATGFDRPGFPGMGSWVSYGLGSMNDNLPTFVVLPDHRGFASNGPKNWSSAFLPAINQGTIIRPGTKEPITHLNAPESAAYLTPQAETDAGQLLAKLNNEHFAQRASDSRLDARIKSYELAARMQLAAPEALDISGEPDYIRKMYGLEPDGRSWPKEINWREEADYFGRKCLTARRLLERGVRFVQVWSGNDNGFPRRNWDSHEDIERDHGPLSRGMAIGAAALIKDLKQRGMLDDTLILWTTEFGRMPSTQGSKGRDHNPHVFTNWLAGGGIKGGISHGESDQWGYKPADRKNPTQVYDIHATILHQLGLDHERLTFRKDSIDRRLTDVHGHLIEEILA